MLFCKSKEKLETHHINWQKDCEENRVKINLILIKILIIIY